MVTNTDHGTPWCAVQQGIDQQGIDQSGRALGSTLCKIQSAHIICVYTGLNMITKSTLLSKTVSLFKTHNIGCCYVHFNDKLPFKQTYQKCLVLPVLQLSKARMFCIQNSIIMYLSYKRHTVHKQLRPTLELTAFYGGQSSFTNLTCWMCKRLRGMNGKTFYDIYDVICDVTLTVGGVGPVILK